MTGTTPSFLLHPLDLLGGDIIQELAFFPGMDLSSNQKLKIFQKVINILQKSFMLKSLNQHADSLFQKGNLNERSIAFASNLKRSAPQTSDNWNAVYLSRGRLTWGAYTGIVVHDCITIHYAMYLEFSMSNYSVISKIG